MLARGAVRRAALALLSIALAGAANAASHPAGTFDFYVLALSWSPSYCAAEGSDADPQQCRSAKPLAFVVHGLWPQDERGFPQNCATRQRDVPRETARGLRDLMPSAGLVRHEWRAHGACSGLSPEDYFATLRRARERVSVPTPFRQTGAPRTVDPRAVERLFLAANPGLGANGVAVTCDDRFLREVRICLTKDLSFRACPDVDRRACRRASVRMPAVGGN